MSIEAIKTELERLPAEERRKLMAFMVVLEDKERAGYPSKLAEKIDDKTSGRWLTLEQCERKLGLTDETE